MITKRLLPLVTLVLATTLMACGQPDLVTYIPEGGDYAEADLAALLSGTDLDEVAETGAGDAVAVRDAALREIRALGDAEAALADVLTSDFPVGTISVPAHVERGTYEGSQAWIVIEAAPDDTGTLTYRRLWVFTADTYAVVAALSSR